MELSAFVAVCPLVVEERPEDGLVLRSRLQKHPDMARLRRLVVLCLRILGVWRAEDVEPAEVLDLVLRVVAAEAGVHVRVPLRQP